MAVTKYSKKPEVVEAIQYVGTNVQEMLDFMGGLGTFQDGVLRLAEGPGYVVEKDWWVLKDFGDRHSVFAPNFLDYYKPGGGP